MMVRKYTIHDGFKWLTITLLLMIAFDPREQGVSKVKLVITYKGVLWLSLKNILAVCINTYDGHFVCLIE